MLNDGDEGEHKSPRPSAFDNKLLPSYRHRNTIVSNMSRAHIAAQYTRILAQWPKDILRPETDFLKILQKRIESPPIPFRNEDQEISAATRLLDNTFTKQARLPERLLRPASNPAHYEDLKRELSEMPNRSWLQNTMLRLKNMVRFT